MNQTEQTLLALSVQANQDERLRARLLATRQAPDPMDAFCTIATQAGFPVTVGELFSLGQENSDNQCKSTNGGNPTPYDAFDDAYENFLTSLK